MDDDRSPEVKRKWEKFLEKHDFSEKWLWQYWRDDSRSQNQINKKIMNHFDSKLKAQKEVKKLVRGGIPSSLRGSVWWASSGAADKMLEASSLHTYEFYVSQGCHPANPATDDIEKDILRTFLVHGAENTEEAVALLRRVLLAYSARNRQVGYCQSMNFLAATLLMIMEEEHAFWVLAALIEDILPNNYYSATMIGCRTDQRVSTLSTVNLSNKYADDD